MTIRARLALGSAAAVAIAIVLASMAVYFLVQKELRAQVDSNLRAEAAQIAGGARFTTYLAYAPNIYEIDLPAPLFSGYFQLVDRRGQHLHPERLRLAEAAARGHRARPAGRERQAAGVLLRHAAPGRRHARPHDAGDDAARRSRSRSSASSRASTTSSPASGSGCSCSRVTGIGIAAVAGFLVARATLRPLRELSETAERVRATRDLSERIAVEGTDEIGALASTFNAMLESLDEAPQRQRQLVQDASHELRTPLTSLRTNIEVLAMGDRLPAGERKQLLEDVVAQLGEMTELIGELTQLARGEEQAEPLEDVRLDLVTEEAIKRAARNHPDVPIEAELEPTSIVGQPAGLERAITNLLDNAAKWSPGRSPVEVRLRDGELTVRDHGPGIAAEDVPHVFERFYRATSARSMPGSGLGLAIVRQVAESHHGTISAETAPGGGTLMRLRLESAVPAQADASSAAAEHVGVSDS